ncbi:MAG: 3'-5' exonuclease [Chloroflexi bacterium]|nr:3'-5' exonuclease [Chloroflexota bacterium]
MSRWSAIRKAKAWLDRQPVYLDTETTGLGPEAEVIEIAIVDADGRPLLDTLIRPQGEVPEDASRVHGLTTAMLQGAPTWPQVWPQIQAALAGRLVLMYNASYDLRVMEQTAARYGMTFDIPGAEFGDLLELYSEYKGVRGQEGDLRRWRLEQAGRELQIPIPNSHRALDDTLLAREVHRKIANEPLPWG